MSSTSISETTLETNQKREHIFLDSSDPSMPNQVFLHDSTSPSFIKLPFPPCIDPYKLISNKKLDSSMGRIPTRTPNAFILYRKIFIESARKEGYHLPMTVISSMASKSWKHEPDYVKEEYKRISKQAFEIRKQLLPKSDRKKKKETWNFVSFSKKSNLNDNSNKLEMKISGNCQNKDIIQLKELDSYNPSLDTTNLFPSADDTSNNVDYDENVPYTKDQFPNSNYQMYDQKSLNYTDLAHNSYISHNDNKNIGFDGSLSHSNDTNIYDTNQHINHDDPYSTVVDSVDISLMQNSHYNFQTYYNI